MAVGFLGRKRFAFRQLRIRARALAIMRHWPQVGYPEAMTLSNQIEESWLKERERVETPPRLA